MSEKVYRRLSKAPYKTSATQRAAARKRYWANRKKALLYAKRYRKTHKAQAKKQYRAWRKKNLGHVKREYQKWRKENYALYRKIKEDWRKKNIKKWRKYSNDSYWRHRKKRLAAGARYREKIKKAKKRGLRHAPTSSST